jgi:predicted dinucleotide-binding enzyme
MRIGIIGAGNIGGTLARRLAGEGHDVVVANRRGPDAMGELLADLGDRGRAGDVAEAARFGDVVIVATPLSAVADLPADALEGKVVVDANNYYPGRDGTIATLDSGATTSSELLAARVPSARVVKAFNTMFWQRLRDAGRPAGDPDRLAMPLAADDDEAKATVATLIDELGFDAVDNGRLADGRDQEPGTPVYNEPIGADEARRRLGR